MKSDYRQYSPYPAGATSFSPAPPGHVFGFIIFLMFFLPSRQLSRFQLAFVQTDFTEIGAILLPLVYLFFYRRQVAQSPFSTRTSILFLLFCCGLVWSGIMFVVFYSASSLTPFVTRNIRMMVPFLGAGLVAIQGIKIDRQGFIRWLSVAMLVSYFILALTYVTGYQRITEFEGIENISGAAQGGRFANQNWQFGIVGLFLLIDPLKRAFCRTSFDRQLVFLVGVLSLVQMVLAFNRTFLIMATIELLFIAVYVVQTKITVMPRLVVAVVAVLISFIVAYHSSEDFQRQIDSRILAFFENAQEATDLAWNAAKRREFFEAASESLQEHWMLGVEPGAPIFLQKMGSGWKEIYQVDTAIIAIWLRFGLLPLCLFVSFWASFVADMWRDGSDSRRDRYWRNYGKGSMVILVTYILTTVNTSSLTLQNAVFFGIFFPFFWRDGFAHLKEQQRKS